MIESFIYAVPAVLLVVAVWDGARRHYVLREREIDVKSQAVGELQAQHAAKTEKRLQDLEKNQIELARRLDGSPKLSKFARG